MHNSLRLLPILGALALAACDKPQVHSLNAPLNLPQPAEENTEGPFDLRGFGTILVQTRLYGEPGQRSSWITLQAQDEAHAALTASKYRADLLGFGDLKPVSDTKLPATILSLDGTGLWLIGHEGKNCHVLFARDLPALQKLAESVGATAWQPAAEKAYPGWLDGFDNGGLAIWYGGGGANVDIASEFPWIKERDFAFCSQPPKESRYVAPGVLDTTFTDWFSAMCQEHGIKYRTLIWASRPQWAWTRQPLPYVKPHPGFIPQPDMSYSKNTVHDAFEPISATDPYVWDFRRRFTESVRDDDNLMGYHTLGEVPDAGVAILASVAGMPETKAAWHRYLQEVLGFDLAKVSLLHTGKADTYKSWDEVAVPIPEDFMGFDDKTVELAGQWEGLPDREKVGITQSWFAPGTMPAEGWQSVRSNDPMLLMYGGGSSPKVREKVADYWLRKNFTVTANQLADLKYLHVQRSIWHGPAYSTFVDAFLNGQPLKAITRDDTGELTATFDVQGLLKDGENQLVLCMHGSPPAGFINLSSLPLRKYPTMTNPENRLWFDAVNFSAWLRLQAAEGILKATRATDPNRPLKIMATINLLDMTEALCAKYGAYQHDTGGAGGYWAPMTGARLARSRGMPWSCEQGGPPKDMAAMQAAMTFYLMYGNDAADLVFATTHYKDKPDVAAWVDNNLALMHCIGKMDLPPQDIAILRSSRTTRMGFSEPWNWDIARGALQGIGRNFVYVEVPDFYSGLAEKYPIIVDDGTVLLTEDDVAGIKKYVEAGGTFVAQHHTGRHLPDQADAWPLAKAFGLKVEPRLINDDNYHQWPMAKITFTEDQSLVPSLRGQTCEGSGVAIDYLDRTHTGAVSLSGEGDSIQPIARWEDGTMAIAEVKAGKGRMVYLGSPFYTRMKDSQGLWVNNERQQALLDEMLVSLGAQRQSWSGNPDIWAEHWRSKNGIYDLYPVARMTKKGEETVSATVSIRRDTPISEVVEISANGHPRLPVTWADDRFTLPEQTFTPMQIRIFAAPRPDPELAVLHWFEIQRQLWRGLQPLPASDYPQAIEQEESILPLAQDWLMTTGQSGTDWIQPGFDSAAWKTVKLGTFKTMGIPEDTVAQFRRVIPIPDSWKGRPVQLVFNTEWSYGITNGQLWINGQPANVKQPLMAYGNSSFSIDISEQAKQGPITLALQIDGTKNVPDPTKPRSRPVGVTGIFYLESEEPPVTITPLAGPWLAASDVNVFTPVSIGQDAAFNYLETKFTLPAQWPGKRVFLQTPGTLGWFILNDHIVETPAWMKSIDISGMVNPSGENVLRWVPSNHQAPNYKFIVKTKIPELSLAWKN